MPLSTSSTCSPSPSKPIAPTTNFPASPQQPPPPPRHHYRRSVIVRRNSPEPTFPVLPTPPSPPSFFPPLPFDFAGQRSPATPLLRRPARPPGPQRRTPRTPAAHTTQGHLFSSELLDSWLQNIKRHLLHPPDEPEQSNGAVMADTRSGLRSFGEDPLSRGRFLQHIEGLRKSSSSPWFLLSSLSYSDIPRKKSKYTPAQERQMIDRFRLHVKGGDGGSGCLSFRRSRHDRHGKPDGGNGGRGGNVILQCSPSVWDFRSLRHQHHINGRRGGNGASKNQIGTRGEDQIVLVPMGTVIHLVDGEIPAEVEKPSLGDLDPWDLPGLLSSEAAECDQASDNSNFLLSKAAERDAVSNISSPHVKRNVGKIAGLNKYSQKSPFESCRMPLSGDISEDPKKMVLSSTGGSGGECVAYQYDLETDESRSADDSEADNEEIQYNVAELAEEGQQIIVACGGEGGLGSVSAGKFLMKSIALKNSNAAAEVSDDENQSSVNIGLPGSEAVLVLELKSIADVGLVGMPNAGKSTLLGAISRAKPTVGHYAFTTLRPNLGKLKYDDLSITVADIPGLIKGAHANRGLGHSFLRHIERTKVLAYVVDLAATLGGRKGIPPWEQLKDLVLELDYYKEGLTDLPSLVVANKMDEAGAEAVYEELQRRVQGVPIFPVCAILEEGIPELKAGLKELVGGGESSGLSVDRILID